MAGGIARIPQIDAPEVATPDIGNRPRPALLDTHSAEQPLAAAVQAIGQDGSQVVNMLRIQQRQKIILDSSAAGANYKTDADNALGQIKQQYSPDQWIAQGQKALGDLTTKYTSDPANAHIASYLTGHLPKLQQQMLGGLTVDALHQTGVAQDDQVKQMGSAMANESANATDPDQQMAIRAGFQSRLEAMRPQNSTWQAAHMQAFDDQVIPGTADRMAHNAPDPANPNALNDFMDAHTGYFTQEKRAALLNTQVQAIAQPMKAQDAAREALRAQSLDYQNKFIAANGHPDDVRLADDMNHGVLNDKDYAGFKGMQYDRPTPPDLLQTWKDRILNAHSQDDIDRARQDLNFAAGVSKAVNGKDAMGLQDMMGQREREIKLPAGQADLKARATLDATYYPTTRQDRILLARHPGIFQQTRQQALIAYEAATYGKPADPAVYQKALEDAIKAYPRPGGEVAKQPPVEATPAVPMTDAGKIALGRKLGIIH